MVPFGPYKDFADCTSQQKAKGKSDESANKICGSLQSKMGGSLKQAVDYQDCLDQASEFGLEDDAAQRICDSITGNNDEENTQQDNQDDSQNNDDALNGSAADDWYKSAANSKMIENCIKAKQKKDDSLSDDDAAKECNDAFKEGNLQQQNQFTDPGKLDNYLSTEAIDWHSDAEADYNEKSDTKEIDLSYYDDDINKCVDEQVKNGLSQENARSFCNNLANYNGADDIQENDEQLPVNYQNREYVEGSDTGSHIASIVDDGENNLSAEPATHNYKDGGDDFGPTFNHIQNDSTDGDGHSGGDGENDIEDEPDTINVSDNSNLDDNQHIDDGNFIEEMESFLEDIEADLGLDDSGDDNTKGAYYSPQQTSLIDGDPLEGGDSDTPQIGSPVVTGHGENNLNPDPHNHDLGNDGPYYDHFGNAVVNEADNSAPDVYSGETNSNLDNNDHIRKHMHPAQKGVGRGLIDIGNFAPSNTPPGEDEPASQEAGEETAAAESPGVAPSGASMTPGPASAFDNGIKEGMMLKKGESLAVKSATTNWIKNGTTYSASQCIQDFGSDIDATHICEYISKNYSGSYDAYVADMRIEPFEANNKLFVKAFLMDPSLNMNKWGVSPLTLDANIRSYIGKPLVLQNNFDHPISADDNLQHQLEYQELFRVGTIVDVVNKNGKYEAISEVTDPYAQKAFREGNLPLYVSPQLYKLDGNEPDGQMTKWTGTHLAIVKDPAYGIKLATINGECTGEHDKCMTYLKKAAIIRDHGYGNCGYCNYKVLKSATLSVPDVPDANKKMKRRQSVPDADKVQSLPPSSLTATQKMETTEIPDNVITNPATSEQSTGVKKKKQIKTQDQELMIPPGDAYHGGATVPEQAPNVNHAPWVKDVHTLEENIEHEKTLQARIEEDSRFIANMEKFIQEMKDDLRLSTR